MQTPKSNQTEMPCLYESVLKTHKTWRIAGSSGKALENLTPGHYGFTSGPNTLKKKKSNSPHPSSLFIFFLEIVLTTAKSGRHEKK